MRQVKKSGVKVSIASSSKPCFYRNRRPRGWTFYLAVTENERRRIDAFEVLKPSVFSYVPGRDIEAFFEFFRSPYAAVREAMKSANAALEPTTWFILNLHVTDNAVAQLFMNTEEPCLKHGPQGKGFRVYGTLDISKLDKAWDQMKKDALGIDAWKEMPLKSVFPTLPASAQNVRSRMRKFSSRRSHVKNGIAHYVGTSTSSTRSKPRSRTLNTKNFI